MVLDELIPMLSSQGLDTSRVGFLGWSMGGYGALLLGAQARAGTHRRDLRGQPGVVDVVRRDRPGAFDGADDYAANSVWGLPQLGSDTDPDRLRQQRSRSTRRRSSSSRSCPARRAGGFSRRTRRRVLELAAAALDWIAPCDRASASA